MTPLRHVRLSPLTDGRTFELATWDTGPRELVRRHYVPF